MVSDATYLNLGKIPTTITTYNIEGDNKLQLLQTTKLCDSPFRDLRWGLSQSSVLRVIVKSRRSINRQITITTTAITTIRPRWGHDEQVVVDVQVDQVAERGLKITHKLITLAFGIHHLISEFCLIIRKP